jgi:ATP-dependent helicase HrpB
VLVFLPGMGEIRRAARELEALARERDVELLELYGDQRAEEQDRAFSAGARRRVLLATNVAETSITVPGIDFVVDSGLARVASHDAGRGVDRLELKRISKASATQRAGRAGRLGPGRALRLWTEAEHTGMREHELPEIRRVDLTSCVLELHVWGERDLSCFGWFEAPDPAAVARSEQLLVRLGALAPGDLAPTELGRALVRIPAHPRLARILYACSEIGALEQGALFCALLSERDVLRRSPAGRELRLPTGPSDLLARRDLVAGRPAAFELDRGALRAVERTRAQLERVAARTFPGGPRQSGAADERQLLHAVFTGFPDRLAVRSRPGGTEGRMVGGTGVVLAPESAVREEPLFCVLDCELGRRAERSRARVRQASAVRHEWLEAVPGEALHVEEETRLEAERVIRVRRTLYEDMLLEEVELGRPDEAQATRLLIEAARRDPVGALGRTPALESFLSRVRSLAAWMRELDLPALEDADLIDAIEPWCAGKTKLADLRSIPLLDVVRSRLSRDQLHALETHAPETLALPSGTQRRLTYEPPKPPVLAVRLQELFGLRATPTVAAGRVPVLLHLLGPNMRVVQITQDLESFWNNTYPEVRKDLRGRYPKHSWPEDPWSAEPTARTKRRRPGR